MTPGKLVSIKEKIVNDENSYPESECDETDERKRH
jgi:hypothetical protein